MDLPTCPSCGQSVLDDDATDCPFCGAAMDGTAAKKSSGKSAAAAKQQKASEDDNEDPFAIEQAPTVKKVVPCARKPMKGRMHRVVCPMCDSPGFIPRGAIGRQVKCANKECLVPVFTADDGKPREATRAPSRVSDETVASEASVKSGGSKKNPLVIYGIVGAVALAATIGLVTWLNGQGVTELGAIDPGSIKQFPKGDLEEEVVATPQPDATEQTPEYRKLASEVVEEMIEQSRVSGGNRDKAYCRRLTGDSFLRMGMMEQAKAEFDQMERVSRDRRTEYYRITPLLTQYWAKSGAGDAAGAAADLAAAKALAADIPSAGDTAIESSLGLAAAMIHSGDLPAATQALTKHNVDKTVVSQMDSLRLAAWASIATALQNVNRPPPSPVRVFSWDEPLRTAVALELAIRGEWAGATAWAVTIQDLRGAGDAFAAIATEMVVQKSMTAAPQLLTAAATKGADVEFRTNSALARSSTTHWQAATASFNGLPEVTTAALPDVATIIKASAPVLDASLLRADAIAQYTIAAASQGDEEAAAAGLTRLFTEVTSVVPPTAVVREASAEVAQSDSNNSLKTRIEKELRLRNGEIRTKFLAYRRGVDRILFASEARHLETIYLLGRIVDGGGLNAVKKVIAGTSELKREIGVDDTRALLFAAAAANGEAFPEALANDPESAVQLFRAEPPFELTIVRPMLSAWQGYLAGRLNGAVALESVPNLQGFASATIRFIAERLSTKGGEPQALVDVILKLKNVVWREQCLTTVARNFTRAGAVDKTSGVIRKLVKSPSQKVAAFYGVVRGALDVDAAEQDE